MRGKDGYTNRLDHIFGLQQHLIGSEISLQISEENKHDIWPL